MARKSSISRLKPDVRAHIERRLREGRLTLDELIQDLQQAFPAAEHPSRSALGRYSQTFSQLVANMRQQDEMARLLVAELGENPDEKAGALMVQAVTALTTSAAMTMQAAGAETDIEGVQKLAKAARDAMAARKVSREERVQIERMAREKQLAEQTARLEEMRGSDGMSEQLESRIRSILLGKS